jgi:pimeloyl-ACP methyl ester carboxylesterase
MEMAASPTTSLPRPSAAQLHAPDGIVLAADRWEGDPAKPPVLFLHGFGQTRQAWGTTARRLADAGHASVALDGRGHGQSGWNAAHEAYSMEQFVADIEHVARGHARRPVLVGASMGGLLGLLTEGESASGLYEALVLVDITPRWESQGVERILGFMGAHPEGFASLEAAADAIAAYLPHRRRKSPHELRSLLVAQPDGRWRWHWDPRLLDEVAREGERYQSRLIAAARRVRAPTLLVSGGLSDLVSDATVREFLQLVPHAEHVRIADATHMVAGDRNDAFTGAILDFLTVLPERRASFPGAAP